MTTQAYWQLRRKLSFLKDSITEAQIVLDTIRVELEAAYAPRQPPATNYPTAQKPPAAAPNAPRTSEKSQ